MGSFPYQEVKMRTYEEIMYGPLRWWEIALLIAYGSIGLVAFTYAPYVIASIFR